MKVTLVDYMGNDLSVVNAARVSFDKESKWAQQEVVLYSKATGTYSKHTIEQAGVLKERDKRLIRFLARGITSADFEDFLYEVSEIGWSYIETLTEEHKKELINKLKEWRREPTHFTPFAHPHVTFRVKAPIFVARQLAKHQVGFIWSEVSRRYVEDTPDFYIPLEWRRKAEDKKQGSGATYLPEEGEGFYMAFLEEYKGCLDAYQDALDYGLCPEQARMVLPQSMFTEWIWTGSLYGWAQVYNQRKPGSHAQQECWVIAEQIDKHMAKLFPVSWEALTK